MLQEYYLVILQNVFWRNQYHHKEIWQVPSFLGRGLLWLWLFYPGYHMISVSWASTSVYFIEGFLKVYKTNTVRFFFLPFILGIIKPRGHWPDDCHLMLTSGGSEFVIQLISQAWNHVGLSSVFCEHLVISHIKVVCCKFFSHWYSTDAMVVAGQSEVPLSGMAPCNFYFRYLILLVHPFSMLQLGYYQAQRICHLILTWWLSLILHHESSSFNE